MKKMRSIAFCAVLGAIAFGDGASACEPFGVSAPVEGREFRYVDMNKNQVVDAGDKRIGRDTLYDDTGNQIGRVFGVETFFAVDGQGVVTNWKVDQVYAFTDGAIFAFGQFDTPHNVLANSLAALKQSKPHSQKAQIIGGTGAYTGADGAVDFAFVEGNGSFKFDVDCD